MAKVKDAVIFLESTKLEVFESTTGKVTQLSFPVGSIVDYEVTDEDKLRALILSFFQQNKFTFIEYVIVVGSSLLFQKDFSSTPTASPTPPTQGQPASLPQPLTSAQIQAAKQKFLDLVPFQTVISTEIEVNKTSRVVASNKEICDVVEKIAMPGTILKAIFPLSILTTGTQQVSSLTPDIARRALKIEAIKQYNMVHRSENTSQAPQKSFIKKQKKQDLLLGGVFLVLILVLGGMLVPMFLAQNKTPPKVLVKNSTPSPSPTASLKVASVPSSSSSANLASLSVKIVHTLQNAAIANSLQVSLEKKGFSTITTESVSTTSAGTLVVLGPKVGLNTETLLSNILKTNIPNVSIQNNNSAIYDILITIGSSD